MGETSANREALGRLRRSWLVVAIIWAVVWLAGYGLLRPTWPPAERWLIRAALVLAYTLWVLWRFLPLNHRPGESALLPHLGAGNILSLFRGLCIGLIAGFLFSPWPMGRLAWVIALLYTAADIADYFDGYLARRADHVTALGSQLDIEFDSLGLLVVSLLAVFFGQLPVWYLALGLARYAFLAGLWWRQQRGRPVYDLPLSVHRRIFAGFQMGFMSVVLWPVVPASMATIAGTIFGAFTLAGFTRDWLVVSGGINPLSPQYRQAQVGMYRLLAQWLPPIWRLVFVASMASVLSQADPLLQPAAWRTLLADWRLPAAGAMASLLTILALAGTALVGAGILARLLAIPLALPIGFDMATRGLQWDNALALVAIVFIMLFGAGPLSLWRPEEAFFSRRLGEQARAAE